MPPTQVLAGVHNREPADSLNGEQQPFYKLRHYPHSQREEC